MAQVAEGGLSGINDMLQRMRELAVQAANSTNTTGASGDIDKMGKEYTELGNEVARMMQATQFNGASILSGVAADYTFQVGANSGAENQITIGSAVLSMENTDLSAAISGGASALDTATNSGNLNVLSALDTALEAVNNARASLGAVQNRFENTVSFLNTAVENQSAARGRIMDTDFAKETANLSRTQILQQAGTAMIAQANQLPQGVLSLLR